MCVRAPSVGLLLLTTVEPDTAVVLRGGGSERGRTRSAIATGGFAIVTVAVVAECALSGEEGGSGVDDDGEMVRKSSIDELPAVVPVGCGGALCTVSRRDR